MTTKIKFFAGSCVTLILLFILTSLNGVGFINDFRDIHEDSVIDPLSYMAVFAVGISIFLLFFSDNIFKLWLRRVVRWFLPVILFAIFILGGDGNSYVAPSKTDLAILSGYALTVITIIFVLVQKFRYKR